jgi:hypothetical protein
MKVKQPMTRKRISTGTSKAKSQRELSRRLNVSRSTIDRLRDDGLTQDAAGSYDVRQAEDLLHRRSLRVAHMKGLSQEAVNAKQRKLAADADMAELKYKQACGELILKDEVQRQWRCALITLKNRFLGLGRELAPRLAGCGPMQIQAAIDSRIFEILRMLANQKYYPIDKLEQDLNLATSPTIQGGEA